MKPAHFPRSVALLVVLGLHVIMLAWSAYVHSPVGDEIGHLPAGLSHWRFNKFDLFAANPPLVRGWATLPVFALGFAEEWEAYSTNLYSRPEFVLGAEFVEANPHSFRLAFFVARLACIPFSLLGALVCFLWARDLYGTGASWFCLLLWVSCPNILGHAALFTPDAHAASFGVAACFVFHRWLTQPSWKWATFAGVMLGVAQLTKFTWLFLYPVLPLFWLAERWMNRSNLETSWARESFQLATIVLISLYVLNMGYGFEETFQPLGKFDFYSESLTGIPPGEVKQPQGNRFTGSWLEHVPVPVPANMLRGIDFVKAEYDYGYESYLRGEHRRGGWWYYYLYAMLVKMPLGTLALMVCGAVVALTHRRQIRIRKQLLIVILPVLVIALVSSQTGFNHHLRYVLPGFPFLFIFGSQAAKLFQARQLLLRALPVACLSCTIVSSLIVFPHSLSYFNTPAGGPRNGWKHLTFSNIDWDQDLYRLKQWYVEHPESRPLHMSRRRFLDPTNLDIECAPVVTVGYPEREQESFPPGWYAVGIREMLAQGSKSAVFLDIEPECFIGYSMRVYHLSDYVAVE